MSLRSRRDFLIQNQNPDGGWGYFPGKQSWLEPTAYATLALQADAAGEAAFQKAVKLVLSWQSQDGGFRPAAKVQSPSWTTALGVTVATVAGRKDEAARGVDHLLSIHGTEADDWLAKVVSRLLPKVQLDRDPSLLGWPWRPDATSWIEPTAHSIVALRIAAANKIERPGLEQRVDLGQRMILSLRCKDGGWNYGSRSALQVDLPSYPETTALALLGLVGHKPSELRDPIEHARQLAVAPQPALATAWLRVALGLHGLQLSGERAEAPDAVSTNDILLNAIEALGSPGGNAQLLAGGNNS